MGGPGTLIALFFCFCVSGAALLFGVHALQKRTEENKGNTLQCVCICVVVYALAMTAAAFLMLMN